MDERRFRAVLEDITATIEDYGEETVIAAFRTVLDRFNYEVVQRHDEQCPSVANEWRCQLHEGHSGFHINEAGFPNHPLQWAS